MNNKKYYQIDIAVSEEVTSPEPIDGMATVVNIEPKVSPKIAAAIKKTAQKTPTINNKKIQKIKQEMELGTYKEDNEKLATKLLQDTDFVEILMKEF